MIEWKTIEISESIEDRKFYLGLSVHGIQWAGQEARIILKNAHSQQRYDLGIESPHATQAELLVLLRRFKRSWRTDLESLLWKLDRHIYLSHLIGLNVLEHANVIEHFVCSRIYDSLNLLISRDAHMNRNNH